MDSIAQAIGLRGPNGKEIYVVGFTIGDAKSLCSEDGQPCDPFVVVECCDKQYQTKILENRSVVDPVPFNENCIWPSVELYPKEFECAFIEFKVYARNWFTRNYLIGKASLQLSFINKRRHHLYAKKWLCLRGEESPEVVGMLNVTVFALRPGQPPPSKSEQDNQGDADENDQEADEEWKTDLSKVVLKATIEAPPGKGHYAQINLHRVDDLREACSPYVTVEFAGSLLKTQMAQNVQQYSFNAMVQIPVKTPIYEDTIIVKLWKSKYLMSDELLAQGLISFSELRNNALPPRWFNLYGWNPAEIPDVSLLVASGIEPEANYYIGRLLISGRVEPQDQDEDKLQEAKIGVVRQVEEPTMNQLALFADVYAVVGAEGSRCIVEVSFGSVAKECASEQKMFGGVTSRSEARGENQEDEAAEQNLLTESVSTFQFKEAKGRVDALLVMAPDEAQSQPKVMLSVYVESALSARQRVCCAMLGLDEFPWYDAGNPSKPRYVALNPMPGNAQSRNPPSVLITLERNRSEDVVRHARKIIKPMVYLLRAYVFMARHISYRDKSPDAEPDSFSLRVACAGVSKVTKEHRGPRPVWMTPVELKVTLFSDSAKENPTIEPITVTLVRSGTTFDAMLRNMDLGKAVCTYTQLRKKDNLGNWEPYSLMPQWIKVFGGQYGNQQVGELLVGFELQLWKERDRPDLKARNMWPQLEDRFLRKEHFCRLRKATLHFSLLGLRDLFPVSRMGMVSKPVVYVEVNTFSNPDEEDERDPAEGTFLDGKQLKFEYRPVIPGGDHRVKSEQLKTWTSRTGPNLDITASNFEFLQVGKMNVLIPDDMALEPFITIKVVETAGGLSQSLFGSGEVLIGESRQSLVHLRPCCWLLSEEALRDGHLSDTQVKLALRKSEEASRVQDKFKELSEEELKEKVKKDRAEAEAESSVAKQLRQLQDALAAQKEAHKERVNSTALPEELREQNSARRPLDIKKGVQYVNMQLRRDQRFDPRRGEDVKSFGQDNSKKVVHGPIENSIERPFENDFWYKSMPLLRNSDVIDRESDAQWHFQSPGNVFGFVKCAFKLTDGWEDPDDYAKPVALAQFDEEEREESIEEKIKRSYGFPKELNEFAFDEKMLHMKFKAAEKVPSRVRVRLYVVKAVCSFSKAGAGFADPYIDFQLGEKQHVSMRNMARIATNTPDFYRMEERDVMLPEEGRLELRIMDKEDFSITADSLIGSTVIDLEDRWHSTKWRNLNEVQNVPIEIRPLCTAEEPGRNRGSIEMWLEMIDTVNASDTKASDLRPPPDAELEVRVVVWRTKNVKIIQGETVNIQISSELDCGEYLGEHPKLQETDVHYTSKDGNGVFNWRMVYPRIKMPTQTCTLKFAVHHFEMLGTTYIGSVSVDLIKYLNAVAKDMELLTVGPTDLKFQSPDAVDGPEAEDIGSLNCTLYVLTTPDAQSRRAGIARDEPNEHPTLFTPTEGRDWGTYLAGLGFSLPDFGLWKKLLPLLIILVVFLVAVIGLKQMGLL